MFEEVVERSNCASDWRPGISGELRMNLLSKLKPKFADSNTMHDKSIVFVRELHIIVSKITDRVMKKFGGYITFRVTVDNVNYARR